VRFRQKRRERRFGKHVRYACRKQLADARPRVKGRFVKAPVPTSSAPSVVPIKISSPAAKKNKATEEAPQVVPVLE